MSELSKLPAYKCHKTVHALRIAEIEGHGGPEDVLRFFDVGSVPICVTKDWMRAHNPVVGGYYVVYEDGYASFSPAEAFEAGYTRIEDPRPACSAGEFNLSGLQLPDGRLNLPSCGRIVHVVLDDGRHRPAIVTNTWCEQFPDLTPPRPTEDTDPSIMSFLSIRTNLFLNVEEIGRVTMQNPDAFMPYDAAHSPGSWHWPERV